MASIIKRPVRIVNAKNFLAAYDGVPTLDNRLYLAISGTTAWPTETSPPLPVDTVDEVTSFWSELIGAHLLSTTDISIATPRVNWTSGNMYYVYDTSLEDPFATKPCYVMNSNYDVYVCEGVGGSTSTSEPVHTSGSVVAPDGYTWRYVFTVSAYGQLELLSDSWIPVTATLNQTDSLLIDARYMILRAKLLDTDLPVGVTYRKVAIISNPILVDGATPASATNALPAELTSNSGDMIFLENRSPVTRATAQYEDIKAVLEF